MSSDTPFYHLEMDDEKEKRLLVREMELASFAVWDLNTPGESFTEHCSGISIYPSEMDVWFRRKGMTCEENPVGEDAKRNAAEKSFGRGEVVFRSEPWVYTVKPEYLQRLCYRCLWPLPYASRSNGTSDFGSDKSTLEVTNGDPPDTTREKWCGCAHHKARPILMSSSVRFDGFLSPQGLVKWLPELADMGADTSEGAASSNTKGRHSLECLFLSRLTSRQEAKEFPCDFFITLSAMRKLQLGQSGDVPSASSSQNIRDFYSLLSHTHRWRHTQSFRLVKQCFAKLLLPDEMPLDETLLTIFGAFQINSFSVRDAASVIIGEGLYLQPSMVNHSCQRNAVFYFEGTNLVIKTIEDVPSLSQVRISYMEVFKPTCERQRRCITGYCFRCACHLCTIPCKVKELCGLRCATLNCNGSILLADDGPLPCSVCGHSFGEGEEGRLKEADLVSRRYMEGMEELDERMELLCRSSTEPVQWSADSLLKDCQAILSRCAPLLAADHMLLGMAYDRRARILLNLHPLDYREAFVAAEKSLPAIRLFFGICDTRVAVQLMFCGLLACTDSVDNVEAAQTYLQGAVDILTVSDGAERFLCRVGRHLLHAVSGESRCSALEGSHESKEPQWMKVVLKTLNSLTSFRIWYDPEWFAADIDLSSRSV